jgi:hypothetical protein
LRVGLFRQFNGFFRFSHRVDDLADKPRLQRNY